MKKMVLFTVLILFSGVMFCQAFSVSGDSVTMCIAKTREGTQLRGKLAYENTEQIIIIDVVLGEVTLQKKNVDYFEKMEPNSIYEIEYGNNNRVTGKIVSIDKNRWRVNSKSLGIVEIKSTEVKDFFQVKGESKVKDNLGSATEGEEESGELTNIDPGRYFLGTAPFALKKNKCIFQNTEILGNGLSYGLFKNFTISAGGFYFWVPYLNLKYATEVMNNVHFSLGLAGYGWPIFSTNNSSPVSGGPYAQIALGNAESNFSVGAYYPYYGKTSFFVEGNGFADEFGFSAAGIKRIDKRISLMAEDFFMPYPQQTRVYGYYPYTVTYSYYYINMGAAGVKILLSGGLFGSSNSVLNIGMFWIVNSNFSRNNNWLAFPIISYAANFR
ncbi:MAG: hypothetical protein HY063_07075 [Bacteroidetes bacterium]|nr:hypothetical protein [Bacteroidota bacterium]